LQGEIPTEVAKDGQRDTMYNTLLYTITMQHSSQKNMRHISDQNDPQLDQASTKMIHNELHLAPESVFDTVIIIKSEITQQHVEILDGQPITDWNDNDKKHYLTQ